MLFNIIIDWVAGKVVSSGGGVTIADNFTVIDLDYADDIAICGEDAADAQRLLDELGAAAAPVGLGVSVKKTKTLCVGDIDAAISLNGTPLETVESFVYLGSSMDSSIRSSTELQHRIGKAAGAFDALKKSVWTRPGLSLRTKCRVFRTAVLSVLLYGCETWALSNEDINKLEVFQMRKLRKMMGISLLDRRRNKDILQECGLAPLAVEIRERRLRWLGHVLRREDDRIMKRCLLSDPPAGWKRKQGNCASWRRNVDQDLANQYFTFADALNAAQNRNQWRGIVRVSREAPIARMGTALPYRR
jgi:hypothetical protein